MNTKTDTQAQQQAVLSSAELGVTRASEEISAKVDIALALKLISIRLPRDMLAAYKFKAAARGVRYQTLMREALADWLKH